MYVKSDTFLDVWLCSCYIAAHNVSQSAVDTSSETDLARESSEALTTTHAGWTTGEMTNSDKTIPALYIQVCISAKKLMGNIHI